MSSAINKKVKSKEFTGRHMLVLMVTFFGVILAVNIYMMFEAVTTFRGEDIKQSYRQGLDYNQTLEKRSIQNSRGWSADIIINQDHTLVLHIIDQNDFVIRGLEIEGVLKHPVETDLDIPLIFKADANTGSYIATLPTDIKGKRWMKTKASYANSGDGEDVVFETKNEIWLK